MNVDAAMKKRHGRHYTPRPLAEFLAARALLQLSGKSTIRVLDPACGDGELLFAASRVVAETMPGVDLELIGYDLDEDAVTIAAERAESLGVKVQLHHGDFLVVGRELPEHSFDAIITNPPYVRTQQLGQAAAQLLATEFGLTGRIDLTHPFVAMCPSLLVRDGVVGLLCSNRFLTTKAGANIRRVFQTHMRLQELFDLGDTKLFDAAVLPAIAIGTNEPAGAAGTECAFSSAYEVPGAESQSTLSLFEALVSPDDSLIDYDGRSITVKTGTLVTGHSYADPWRISSQDSDQWLAGITASTWKTFGDVAKIRVGIKSTADSVFISDDWDSQARPPEADLLLPLLTHHNVTPWRIAGTLPTRVLYPYNLDAPKRQVLNMDAYPAAMAYLESHGDRLKGRKYVIDGGREWYELWVPQRPAMWASPKIVFPDISENARFAYDTSDAVVNGDCYWISLEDIRDEQIAFLMVAVANSRLGLRFYDEVCGNKLYSGRRRWITQYVARFPLPDPTTDASQELIRRVGALLAHAGEPTSEETAEIDALVERAFEQTESSSSDLTPLSLF